VRHYLEMVVAMLAGMIVPGIPAVWALGALGVTMADLRTDAPAALFLGMAATMTVPMVAWMRHRGHGWRTSAEMSLSMFLPTFAVIALMGAGLMTDLGTLMLLEHVAMPVAMLGVMLLRPSEYTRHAHVEVAS
jgi:hypothetical protein